MHVKICKCYVFVLFAPSIKKNKQIAAILELLVPIPYPHNCLKTTLLDVIAIKTTMPETQK